MHGGFDAQHTFPDCCSLRGNPWRDGPRLRHCSVDAERLVIFSVFGGSIGRFIKTHCEFGGYLVLGFCALCVDASEPVKKRPLKFFPLLEVRAPRLTLPPKVGSA